MDGRPLAAQLLDREDQILASYLAGLKAVDSVLLDDGGSREQLLDQARSILHEVCAELASGTDEADVPGLALSSQIGASRASHRVHPIESLIAADRLFAVVLATGGECLTTLPPARAGDLATRLGVLVSQVMFRRLGEACAAYASLLLEEVRLANEHERQRIARELHDRVSYGLNAGYRQLELAELYAETDASLVRDRLGAAVSLISGTIETTRNLASGLRLGPTSAALADSLLAYARSLGTEIHTFVEVYGEESWLSEGVREETYMILREAMRNAIVHSGAEQMLVRIDIAPRELRATVKDDGRGFDLLDHGHDGMGLESMRERAALITGTVRVQSRRGGGTRVELVAYLPRAGETEAGGG